MADTSILRKRHFPMKMPNKTAFQRAKAQNSQADNSIAPQPYIYLSKHGNNDMVI